VVLAFPMEQVTHSAQAPGFYWFQNSCGSVEFLLTLGIVVPAILTPVLVFLLPTGIHFCGEGRRYLFFLCSFGSPIFCSCIARAGAAAGPWRREVPEDCEFRRGAISRHGIRGGHRDHWAFDVSEERVGTEAHCVFRRQAIPFHIGRRCCDRQFFPKP
jgi:hypothetical protein